MIVFLRTENWTRYLVNCEAGPRWLELQETLFKHQQSVARPRLLNSARLLRHPFDHLLDLDVACLIQVLPWIAGLSCCRGESTPALPQWRRKVRFIRPGQSQSFWVRETVHFSAHSADRLLIRLCLTLRRLKHEKRSGKGEENN